MNEKNYTFASPTHLHGVDTDNFIITFCYSPQANTCIFLINIIHHSKIIIQNMAHYENSDIIILVSDKQDRQCTYSCNNEAHLCNHCCHRKANVLHILSVSDIIILVSDKQDRQRTYSCNNEAHLCNHCRHRKANVLHILSVCL